MDGEGGPPAAAGGEVEASPPPLDPAAVALWRRVESTAELLVAVLAHLDAAKDLGRAAKVCRHWRGAAYEEGLWKAQSKDIPMLAKLEAEPWCRLSWQQLFAQHRGMFCLAERAAKPGLAIGPRNELEHYREIAVDSEEDL
eukprot:COSAG04_NODE_13987_length_584_cov_1.309278_1_plen_140_part_10